MEDYTIVGTRMSYKNKRMEARNITLKTNNGEFFTRTYIHSEPTVMVIVNDENQFCFIREFRITTNQYYWEIPGGLMRNNETPIETAERKAKEEAGIQIENVKLVAKGQNVLLSSLTDENVIITYANKCGETSREDQRYPMLTGEVIWLQKEDVFKRLKNQLENGGKFYGTTILGGATVNALLMYQFLNNNL